MSEQLTLTKADELINLVEKIAEEAYKLIDKLPASEEWDLQSKVRRQTVESLMNVSEACGLLDPRDIAWKLSAGRGNLKSLLSLERLAYKAGYIELEPSNMLDIKKAIELIDYEIVKLPLKAKKWSETYYLSDSEKK